MQFDETLQINTTQRNTKNPHNASKFNKTQKTNITQHHSTKHQKSTQRNEIEKINTTQQNSTKANADSIDQLLGIIDAAFVELRNNSLSKYPAQDKSIYKNKFFHRFSFKLKLLGNFSCNPVTAETRYFNS